METLGAGQAGTTTLFTPGPGRRSASCKQGGLAHLWGSRPAAVHPSVHPSIPSFLRLLLGGVKNNGSCVLARMTLTEGPVRSCV